MAIRLTILDFLRDVAAQSNAAKGIVYVGTINADGTVKVSRNGVVIYPQVWWSMSPNTSPSDVPSAGDTIRAHAADGTWQAGDAQQWLQSLV